MLILLILHCENRLDLKYLKRLQISTQNSACMPAMVQLIIHLLFILLFFSSNHTKLSTTIQNQRLQNYFLAVSFLINLSGKNTTCHDGT